MPALRLARISDLDDPAQLARAAGPFDRAVREPVTQPGFSGARFERIRLERGGESRQLVLKRVRLTEDWTSRLTGDRLGREAAIACGGALAAAWEVFHSPYLACATESGEMALLMEDVSHGLLPNVREPLPAETERRLLAGLARLHARFVDAPALAHPALGSAACVLSVLDAATAEREAARDEAHPVFSRAHEGWRIAQSRLSGEALALLERVPERFESWAAGLPRTLLHGDSKVANFALVSGTEVAAFDWSIALAGPVPIELGYYLAMNAKRLSAGRAAALAAWRNAFEEASGAPISSEDWRRIEDLALVAGAKLVLWSKALALPGGTPAALDEWAFYSEGLDRLAPQLR